MTENPLGDRRWLPPHPIAPIAWYTFQTSACPYDQRPLRCPRPIAVLLRNRSARYAVGFPREARRTRQIVAAAELAGKEAVAVGTKAENMNQALRTKETGEKVVASAPRILDAVVVAAAAGNRDSPSRGCRTPKRRSEEKPVPAPAGPATEAEEAASADAKTQKRERSGATWQSHPGRAAAAPTEPPSRSQRWKTR